MLKERTSKGINLNICNNTTDIKGMQYENQESFIQYCFNYQ